MTTRDFEELLRRAIGLDAASIGAASVERAVQERQCACALDRAAYLERARGDPGELQALVEAIVVPETWFFRDAEAFAALAALARRECAQGEPGRVLRLLSVPCSSGEEPYTIAMALLDAGLAPERFAIDAVDVSLAALRLCELGVYGKNSFRSQELGFRERHFAQVSGGLRISDAVRRPVRFRHGNLVEPGFAPAGTRYDVIFCRNLLIYFDRELQERAARALIALLADGGWLFAGSSEGSLWLRAGLASTRVAQSFAFQRPAPAPAAPRAPARAAPAARAPATPRARARGRAATPPTAPPVAPPAARAAATEPAAGAALDAAERLADQGRLAEAIALCERELQARGPHARAYYLLGLARDAEGESERAAELYRKVLYLEPGHCEALIQLACLIEKQGDESGAQRLRERAERAQLRGREEA